MGFHQSRRATADAVFGSPSAAALATGLPVPFGQSCVAPRDVEIFVTDHAARRFIERIGPGDMTMSQARAAILAHERAIHAAVEIGCQCIRLASGHRLIVKQGAVVTVTPAPPKVHSIQRSGAPLDFRACRRMNGAKRYDQLD